MMPWNTYRLTCERWSRLGAVRRGVAEFIPEPLHRCPGFSLGSLARSAVDLMSPRLIVNTIQSSMGIPGHHWGYQAQNRGD